MEEKDAFWHEMHARFYKAFEEASRNKRGTRDESLFEMNLFENLELLFMEVMSGRYKPSAGIAFVVEDPVVREIFAAPFRDRVVHHFLYDLIVEWWDKRLSFDAYSCRKGKGTLFGIYRLRDMIRKCSQNYTKKVYIAKFDIQGYFMSLPRRGLYERIMWGLNRQFPRGGPKYDLLKYLWYEIIFDDPTAKVEKRGGRNKWRKLPRTKSLFYQPIGRGIVIGNLSSQLLSNIYLDPFDRFMRFELGFKYYGRYVDDFYVVVTEDQLPYLKRCVKIIEMKLLEMGLTLHPRKRSIQSADKGVNFLGAVIYPRRIVPSRRLRNNFYKALQSYEMGYGDEETIISYMGLMKHYNSKKIMARIFDQVGLDFKF